MDPHVADPVSRHEILERMSDAFVLLDREFRFLDANPAAERDMKKSLAELRGCVHWEVFPASYDYEAGKNYRRAAQEQRELHWRQHYSAEGYDIHMEMAAYPTAEGGVAVFWRDVTERVRLEEQLVHAQRLQEMGQLAGGVAHDFNNLLTVIGGSAQLMEVTLPAGHECGADLDAIRGAVERARALVAQLLTFSRRQAVRPRHVQVSRVVAAAERMLQRVLGEDITLALESQDDGVQVLIDPGRLEQVVMNLAINARDAMRTPRHGHPGGGGTLTIRAEADADDPPTLRLSFRDTGHGMDAATCARIFEPFFTTKAVGAGTGLGLSTARSIVEQAGGTLTVASEPGVGTTFTATFPARRGAEAADPTPPPASAPTLAATVLLVEDERAVRHVARRMLERLGCRVLEARHGADALDRWRARRDVIDVVVSDIRMPEMSGAELADRIRAEDPDVPVVFVSGYSDEALERQLGPREQFLEKPYTADQLRRALAAAVARRG